MKTDDAAMDMATKNYSRSEDEEMGEHVCTEVEDVTQVERGRDVKVQVAT